MDLEPYKDWLVRFREALVQSGLSERQAGLYSSEYSDDAQRHYRDGLTPSEACYKELMG